MHLDRTPRSVAPFAKVFAERLLFRTSEVTVALRQRAWIVGEPPSAWSQFTDEIYDPGADEGDDD